jgi:hypothetical protein
MISDGCILEGLQHYILEDRPYTECGAITSMLLTMILFLIFHSIGTNHQPICLLPQPGSSQHVMSSHDGAHSQQEACVALEKADSFHGEGKGEHAVAAGSWTGSAEVDGTQMLVNCDDDDDDDHDHDDDEYKDEDELRAANRQTGPPRFPIPNYRAEFVQSHNPDIADRCVKFCCTHVHYPTL